MIESLFGFLKGFAFQIEANLEVCWSLTRIDGFFLTRFWFHFWDYFRVHLFPFGTVFLWVRFNRPDYCFGRLNRIVFLVLFCRSEFRFVSSAPLILLWFFLFIATGTPRPFSIIVCSFRVPIRRFVFVRIRKTFGFPKFQLFTGILLLGYPRRSRWLLALCCYSFGLFLFAFFAVLLSIKSLYFLIINDQFDKSYQLAGYLVPIVRF